MDIKDFNQLKKNLKKDVSGLREVKIAILGDSATQLLTQAIQGFGIELSYNFNIFEADYNQIEFQTLEPSSELYEFNPEFIIIYFSSIKLIKQFY